MGKSSRCALIILDPDLWLILHFYGFLFIVFFCLELTRILSSFAMQDNIMHLIQSLSPQDIVSRKRHFTFVDYLKISRD